jgi:fatty acid desaturase
MSKALIEENMLRRQAWKYWLVMAAWPAFLILLPLVYEKNLFAAIIFIVFPGTWLFTWLALLMHESWHKYVPGQPNRGMFHTFGWMLLIDPQIYHWAHISHHKHANSYRDIEFYPFGRIHNRNIRRLYHLLQIFLGGIFTQPMMSLGVMRHPQFSQKYSSLKGLASVFIQVFFIVSTGSVAIAISSINLVELAMLYVFAYWSGALLIHHNQLVQHGDLIVNGDYGQRNRATRNLNPNGLMVHIFLFLTHNDALEHVLHHTRPDLYNRPFPGRFPLPDKPVYINAADYPRVLYQMLIDVEPEVQVAG